MSLSYVEAWFIALVLTQLAEVPVYALVGRTGWSAAFIPSFITHPCVWFVFPPLGEWVGMTFAQMLWLAEVWVWLVEAVVVRGLGLSWRRAFAVSALANVSSIALGMATRYWFGFP